MQAAALKKLTDYIRGLKADRIAIAYSGGGDSTALLHMLRNAPSVTHAFIIDHNLRLESSVETAVSAAYARSLGYHVQTQKWNHDGVSGGVQAKARGFRYTAMGEMCRREGIQHLLTAHTSDDQAETLLMRKARDTGWRGLAGMPYASYAPLWPALAEVYLHRPLLNISRCELRDYNKQEGLTWIDDPSNENEDFARIKARSELTVKADLTVKLLEVQIMNRTRLTQEQNLFATWLERYAVLHPQGYISTTRPPPGELLRHILRAVSGTGGPIDAARRDALIEDMARENFNAATLAGAWIVKDKDGFLFTRDMSAVKPRAGATAMLTATTTLPVDRPYLWDGRFMLRAKSTDITVRAAYGLIETMGKTAATKAISLCPISVRGTMPVYEHKGRLIGFGAGDWPEISVQSCQFRRISERFGASTCDASS